MPEEQSLLRMRDFWGVKFFDSSPGHAAPGGGIRIRPPFNPTARFSSFHGEIPACLRSILASDPCFECGVSEV